MKLTQLVKPWIKQLSSNCMINNITQDSRKVQAGDLFIAYPGALSDGRLFIDQAIAAGAVALVYEPHDMPKSYTLPQNVPCIPVPNLAEQLARIASRFYKNPSASLKITGVTGTNGKTTIAYQLAQAHDLLGQKSAYIGTIGQGDIHQLKPIDNTTPDAVCLQKLLYEYKTHNIQQVCMEVSSHALSQHRVDTIEFTQALFTNLTHDHLDYHKTMQAYGAAKAKLFATEHLQWAIINQDDAYHSIMSQVLKPQVKKITYGMHANCDVQAVNWHMDIVGTQIEIHSPWGNHLLKINALGTFNIYNALAVFSSLLASGYDPKDIVLVMERLKAAAGRMEVIAKAPYVLVDYAHTPDALVKALSTLKQLKKGQLWVVFGCGGNRDKTKRPVMGKAATLYADKIILTSDNPRSEPPKNIIEDIALGIATDIPIIKIENRKEAIEYALRHASPEDIILIAGKGHEAYQQIGEVMYPFSDQKIVSTLLHSIAAN